MQKIFAAAIIVISLNAQAQDTTFARKTVQDLCSRNLHGRGYYKKGAIKASEYIAKAYKNAGIEAFGDGYFQTFPMSANSFKGNIFLELEGVRLIPGKDFIVSPEAPTSKVKTGGMYPYIVIPLEMDRIGDSSYQSWILESAADHNRYMPKKGAIYIIDTIPPALKSTSKEFIHKLKLISHTISLVNNKLTWSASTEQGDFASFEVLRSAVESILSMRPISKVQWKIKSGLIQTEQRNVIGYIPGSRQRDSFIYITAHYDHLGQMGKKAMFPGANDNAAGVAMLIDLAKYYKQNPPEYTMVFLAFAGEEAGLVGSYNYVLHPVFPLKQTRFLLNLDLVGTGEGGMTAVNATVFEKEFQLLNKLNDSLQWVPKISRRGKAANSDHYFFSELGIPAFFWYQQGPRSSYHDVFDIPQTLTLAGYNGTYKLAVAFLNALQNNHF